MIVHHGVINYRRNRRQAGGNGGRTAAVAVDDYILGIVAKSVGELGSLREEASRVTSNPGTLMPFALAPLTSSSHFGSPAWGFDLSGSLNGCGTV